MVTTIGRAHPKAFRLALSLLLALGGLATAAVACGQTTGRVITRVTAAPAATLYLKIDVVEDPDGMATIYGATYQARGVGACPTTSPSPTNCAVGLSGHQSLTVNGTRFPNIGDPQTPDYVSDVRIPQQPPGGAYAFVYTDEHGQQTRFSLLAGGLTITSPATGQTVPIPAGPLTIRYTLSAVPPWPNGAHPSVQGTATCCGVASNPSRGSVLVGPFQQPTGVYILSDASAPYGSGFETFQPSPGVVDIVLHAEWTLESSPFAGVQVAMFEHAQSLITWSAA